MTSLVYHDAGTVWVLKNAPLVKIADFGLARLKLRDSEPAEVIFNVRDSFSEVFSRDKDLQKLLDELSKVKPKNAPPELKEALRTIRSLVKKSATLREMLRIPFFDVYTRPVETALSMEECIFSSSDGNVIPAQRAAAGLSPLMTSLVAEANEIPRSVLFESDKIEVMGDAMKRVTRQSRGDQMEYNVWSAGKGTKRSNDDEEDPVAKFLREEDERELAELRIYEAQRRQQAEEDKIPQWLRTIKVVSEPLASVKDRAKLGMTQEEARKEPILASFREASRLARQAEEELKMKRRRKREEEQAGMNVAAPPVFVAHVDDEGENASSGTCDDVCC